MVQIHPSPLAEPDNSAARLHFPFLLREGAMYGVGHLRPLCALSSTMT